MRRAHHILTPATPIRAALLAALLLCPTLLGACDQAATHSTPPPIAAAEANPTATPRPPAPSSPVSPGQGPAADPEAAAAEAGETSDAISPERFVEAVPSDTPYVWATLPAATAANTLDFDTWGPLYETTAADLQTDLRALAGVPFAGLAAAVFDELRGHYTTSGLAELGLLPAPRFAVYGIGPFPVARLEIADPRAVVAALERLERRGGFVPELRKLEGGRTLRVYTDATWRLAVLVDQRSLVMAAAPEAVFDDVTALALRDEPDAGLVVASMLQDTAATLLPDATVAGFVDLEALARAFAGQGDGSSRDWLDRAGYQAPVLGEACTAEASRIAAFLPRVVFASADLAQGQEAALGLSLADQQLLAAFAAAALPIPALPALADDGTGPWGAIAIGGNLAELARLASLAGQATLAAPFACPPLLELNVLAERLRDGVTLVPDFVKAARGLYLVVTEANVTARGVAGLEGTLLLPSKTPANLWRMATGAPKRLKLPPRGRPSALERPDQLDFVADTQLIANKGSLVITAGRSGAAAAGAVANLDLHSGAALIAATYDYGRLMAVYTESLPERLSDTSRDELRAQLFSLGVVSLFVETTPTSLVARYRLRLRVPRGGTE